MFTSRKVEGQNSRNVNLCPLLPGRSTKSKEDIVNTPMVLGHEAAGVVVEVGEQVNNLKPGDCVCMEPGIPDPNSRAARLGIYNLDRPYIFGSLELSLPVSRTI